MLVYDCKKAIRNVSVAFFTFSYSTVFIFNIQDLLIKGD